MINLSLSEELQMEYESILKYVDDNGHICIDDYLLKKNPGVLERIKQKIIDVYRNKEKGYSLDTFTDLQKKLEISNVRRKKLNIYNEEIKEYLIRKNNLEEEIDSLEVEIDGLYIQLENLQLSNNKLLVKDKKNNNIDNLKIIDEKYFNKKKLFEERIDSLKEKIKIRTCEIKETGEKINKRINLINNAQPFEVEYINAKKDLENYIELAYVISDAGKLYLYNSLQYKIEFLMDTNKLQSALRMIKNSSNIRKDTNKKNSIKNQRREIALYSDKLNRNDINESELKELYPLIKQFIDLQKITNNTNEKTEYLTFFRGHPNSNYLSKPSIFRDENFKKNEHLMFREIQISHAEEIKNAESILEKLTMMQHYSLPTRLLDITMGVLIATYFTIEQDKELDGEIIIYRVDKRNMKYFDSDTVEILSSLTLLTYEDKYDLLLQSVKYTLKIILSTFNASRNAYERKRNELINKFNNEFIVQKLSHEIQKNNGHILEDIDPIDLLNTYFVKPKQNNVRIVKQQGAFIINGLIDDVQSNNKNRVMEPKINNYLKNIIINLMDNEMKKKYWEFIDTNVVVKYIIPSNVKEEFEEWLRDLNIDASAIYPDLERMAVYLKAQYGTKNIK